MFSFILLFSVALSASLQADSNDDIMEKCLTIQNAHCCKLKMHNKTTVMDNEVKQCMLMPRIPGSCDRAVCFGTKKGYATADGTIKMDVFQKNLEEKFSDHQDMLEAVKEECLAGSFASYGEPDDCDLNKMEDCIRWQITFRCPNFSDEGPCKGFKDISEKCLKLFS